MKILCIGDVVSKAGRDYLLRRLPSLKRRVGADFVIVNGENAALPNGVDRPSVEDIFAAGADVITGGNHSFQKKDAQLVLEDYARLLRPANLGNTFGHGWVRLEGMRYDLFVVNLQGMLYLPEIANPFTCIEEILTTEVTPRDVVIVDFHAEATGEKQAMGYFLDGKVSLVFGTHTHVQTNDAVILSGGTGYITDVGMTGPIYSVLGKGVDNAVHNFRCWGQPEKRRPVTDAPEPVCLHGIVAHIDERTHACVQIHKISGLS